MAKTLPLERRYPLAKATLDHVNQITEALTVFDDDPQANSLRQAIYDELKAPRIRDEDYGTFDYQDFRPDDQLGPGIRYLAWDPDEGTVLVCTRIRYIRRTPQGNRQLDKSYADTEGVESFHCLWEPTKRLLRLIDQGRDMLRDLGAIADKGEQKGQ